MVDSPKRERKLSNDHCFVQRHSAAAFSRTTGVPLAEVAAAELRRRQGPRARNRDDAPFTAAPHVCGNAHAAVVLPAREALVLRKIVLRQEHRVEQGAISERHPSHLTGKSHASSPGCSYKARRKEPSSRSVKLAGSP
jgi:hypothetical protein